MGWDNFSSYLNLKSSIFNTIFATWREHRGLGVPSDAEVNDVPRQLFSLLLSFFFPKQIVDQIYFALMLWGGVIGMYFLGRHVSLHLKQGGREQELFGFLAAFFYLFNLSTLAVFYFPMIMYVTRFFMLPTLTLILFYFIHNIRISKQKYFLFLIMLFVGFGSFMVPTIFIVMMVAIGLLFLFMDKRKRVAMVIIMFLGLGTYWIFAFANYTIQKASIVPSAPTFIRINESELNKPKAYFSFEQQAKMRPSFFDSQFTNVTTNASQPFHELANSDKKGLTRWLLWIFPLTYLLGIIYIFLFKRNRLLMWFASVTFTFLMLSMKEYSPLGFLYAFISDHVPFAHTVFRFGDTKFHALIAFGGSIVAAAFLTSVIKNYVVKKTMIILFLSALILSQLFIYKSYFTGNLIGFFMYNKLPPAYFDMANIINEDPEAIRVIHLPIDNFGYWKPYTWGYFGSAFFHFMLNKPLFDRAFEPASIENANIHKQLIDMFNVSAAGASDQYLDEQSLNLYQLLRSLSIKYVVDDGTISTNVDARAIAYWGKISSVNSHLVLSHLEKKGYLKLVKQYSISPQDYAKDYAKLYPYNKVLPPTDYRSQNIYLYEVVNTASRLQFLSELDKVHTDYNFPPLGQHYIQAKEFDNQSLIFPFASDPGKIKIENSQIKISLPSSLRSGDYIMESNNDLDSFPTNIVNVSSQQNNGSVKINLEYLIAPIIEGSFQQNRKIVDSVDLTTNHNNYSFIKVGNDVLSVGDSGPLVIRGQSIPISLLYPEDTYNVSNHIIQLEPNPQCLGDALENPLSQITSDNGILNISGQNVSNCLTTEIPVTLLNNNVPISFAQLEFETSAINEKLPQEKYKDTGKPKLDQYVNELENPLIMHVCVKTSESSVCMNKDNLFRLTKDVKKFMVPIVGNLTGIDKFLVTFTVRSSQRQKYETKTTNILFKTFVSSEVKEFSPMKLANYSNTFTIKQNTNIYLKAPLAKSGYSQPLNLQDDGLLLGHDPLCDQPGKYQAIKKAGSGLLSYVVGCKNILNKNTSFSSGNFYLWSVSLKHLSGTIPTFILMDKLNTYTYESLLPPDIDADNYFSPLLQKPEAAVLFGKPVFQEIDESPLYSVAGFLKPKFGLQDNANKELIIEQYAANAGLVQLNNISLVELPNYWANYVIRPANYATEKFDSPNQLVSYKKLLPSVWKIKTKGSGETMLLFNEQYDKQWVVVGAQTLLHARCDGYVNCYKIKLPGGDSQFYLFYIPEALNALGLVITIATILLGYLYYCRRQTTIQN